MDVEFAFYVVTIEILFTGHNKERQFRQGCLENRRENEMSTELEKYYNKFCEEKTPDEKTRKGRIYYLDEIYP